MTSDALIGTTEAAERLGVSRMTVHRLAETGRLPRHTKLPGRTGAALYAREDVEKLAAEREGAAV